MKRAILIAFSIGSLFGLAAAEGRNFAARGRLQSEINRAREQSLSWSVLAEEYEKECRELQKQLEASP